MPKALFERKFIVAKAGAGIIGVDFTQAILGRGQSLQTRGDYAFYHSGSSVFRSTF